MSEITTGDRYTAEIHKVQSAQYGTVYRCNNIIQKPATISIGGCLWFSKPPANMEEAEFFNNVLNRLQKCNTP